MSDQDQELARLHRIIDNMTVDGLNFAAEMQKVGSEMEARIAALEKAVKAADSALGDLYWSDNNIDCMSSTWAAWLKRKAIYDAARAPLGEIK